MNLNIKKYIQNGDARSVMVKKKYCRGIRVKMH